MRVSAATATAWMTGRQPLAVPDTDTGFYTQAASELLNHAGEHINAGFNADLEDRIVWIIERLREQFGAVPDHTAEQIRLQAREIAEQIGNDLAGSATPLPEELDDTADHPGGG